MLMDSIRKTMNHFFHDFSLDKREMEERESFDFGSPPDFSFPTNQMKRKFLRTGFLAVSVPTLFLVACDKKSSSSGGDDEGSSGNETPAVTQKKPGVPAPPQFVLAGNNNSVTINWKAVKELKVIN